MVESLEKKIEFKDKLLNFYNNNKFKIYLSLFILLIGLALTALYENIQNKKANLIAEKYIKAGLYLSENKKSDATILFEEIIISKNKFYSILALNTLIEKELISEKKKILDYFALLEKNDLTDEQQDLISLKKALYFLKISDKKNSDKLLKELIDKNSNIKFLAQDIIGK